MNAGADPLRTKRSSTNALAALDEFRALDEGSPESVLGVIDERQIQLVASAWSRIAPIWYPPIRGGTRGGKRWTTQQGRRPEEEKLVERWEWLWSTTDDTETGAIAWKLAAATGLPRSVAMKAFHRLRSLRLIFPDGTLSIWVREILRRRVHSRIGVDHAG